MKVIALLKYCTMLCVMLSLLWTSSAVTAEDTEAIAALQASATAGNAQAQAELGARYFLGRGLPQDAQQAVKWMQHAAEQGISDAQMFVAAMYDRGTGVAQNSQLATDWYRKAAAQGNGAAQGILGPYQAMRLRAAKQIPDEYAKKILGSKNP